MPYIIMAMNGVNELADFVLIDKNNIPLNLDYFQSESAAVSAFNGASTYMMVEGERKGEILTKEEMQELYRIVILRVI